MNIVFFSRHATPVEENLLNFKMKLLTILHPKHLVKWIWLTLKQRSVFKSNVSYSKGLGGWDNGLVEPKLHFLALILFNHCQPVTLVVLLGIYLQVGGHTDYPQTARALVRTDF